MVTVFTGVDEGDPWDFLIILTSFRTFLTFWYCLSCIWGLKSGLLNGSSPR
jgi:hypothetical protein